MVPKIHVIKFKDLNPYLEDFFEEGPLDDIEGDHLKETPRDLYTEDGNLEENLGHMFMLVEAQYVQVEMDFAKDD